MKNQIFVRPLLRLFFTVGFGISLVTLVLLLQSQPTQAAALPTLPNVPPVNPFGDDSIITSTKTVSSTNLVRPGENLTYTIVFTVDALDNVIVTDSIASVLILQPSTITGTPADSVTTLFSGNIITWTVNNVVAYTPVTLTFAAVVSDSTRNETVITNTAWLSSSNHLISTNLVTNTVIASSTVYLPILLKPQDTVLSIASSNTGNFTVNIRKISDDSIVSTCHVLNNTTSPCDRSFPPGTYIVEVLGTVCGSTRVERTFLPGPKTLPISC